MKHKLLAVLLLVLAPLVVSAQAPRGGEVVGLEYTEETLPNGLKVIYHVDRSAPVAAAVMWYDVASKHEQPGRTGFAHLFEHLMLFTGSRNIPEGQGWAMLEAAGGRAGPDLNGTTSADLLVIGSGRGTEFLFGGPASAADDARPGERPQGTCDIGSGSAVVRLSARGSSCAASYRDPASSFPRHRSRSARPLF